MPTLAELTTAVLRVRTGTAKEAADFIATLESLHARASEADALRALVAAMEELWGKCDYPKCSVISHMRLWERVTALRAELKLP